MALGAEVGLEEGGEVAVVVDQQDPGHGPSPWTRRRRLYRGGQRPRRGGAAARLRLHGMDAEAKSVSAAAAAPARPASGPAPLPRLGEPGAPGPVGFGWLAAWCAQRQVGVPPRSDAAGSRPAGAGDPPATATIRLGTSTAP